MVEPATTSLESRLGEIARMRHLARSLLKDPALADDVIQEASLVALRREGEAAQPRGYWAAIVRNLASKLARGRRRSLERERVAARPEAEPGADEVSQRLALHRAVIAAVDALPLPYRDVVVRRWFDGQKPQCIALELAVPIATVKTRLRRALAQLRVRLKEQWGEGALNALLVLAFPRSMPVAVAGPATGILLMSTNAKIAVGIGIAVAVSWGIREAWVEHPGHGEGRPSANSSAIAETPAPPVAAAPVVARVEEDAPSSVGPTGAMDPRRYSQIRGELHGPKGVALAGTPVELVRRIGSDLQLKQMLADSLPQERIATIAAPDGTFEFLEVPRGVSFDLEATATPELVGRTSGIQAGDLGVHLTLISLSSLKGTVRRVGGAGIDGATVVARTVGGATVTVERRATTDGAGRFEIGGLPSDPLRVRAFTGTGDFVLPQTVTVAAGQCGEVELVLGDAFMVDGIVVDDTSGEPVAGARIYDSYEPHSVPMTTTDAGGRFQMRSITQWPPVLMLVQAEGYGLRDFITPTPTATPAFVVVRLLRGYAIRGRVVDVDGTPIADAVLALNGGQDLSVKGQFSMRNECVVTRSNADGTFALLEVDPRADHVLVARHQALTEAAVELPGDATRRKDIDLGDVVLRQGALVIGRVLDEHGEPVASARVELEPLSADARSLDPIARLRAQFIDFSKQRETYSRADGSFGFGGVPAGEWTGRVRRFGREGLPRTRTIRNDEIIEDFDLVITTGLTICGTVVDSESHPVPVAWVEARSISPIPTGNADTTMKSYPLDRQPTNPDGSGTFRLSGLQPGRYSLFAHIPGNQAFRGQRFVPTTIDHVDAGRADVRIVLRDATSLVGRVFTGQDTPVKGVRVSAFEGERNAVDQSLTDSDGMFELFVPGETSLLIEVRRPPEGLFSVQPVGPVLATLEEVRAEAGRLEIQLPDSGE